MRWLPFASGTRYAAFTDPSGGSADAMTLAIAHFDRATKHVVLDAVREDCRDQDIAFWVFVEGLAGRSAEDFKLPIFEQR